MAADLNAVDLQPWNLIKVLTSGVYKIIVPRHDVLIRHTNIQNDETTVSVATDKIVVMHLVDKAGAVQVMAANMAEGEKMIIDAGQSNVFRGDDLRDNVTEGERAIQLQAIGNGAMVQILTARNFPI